MGLCILGSSFVFSAQGGRGKEKNCKPAEKIAVGSEGEAEGGCGGNSASPEPKRSPAALLVQSRTQQKSFLFLLEEKIGRAQNKKLRRKLFCGTASEASGGGAERQFRSKKFRAKFRISHQQELSEFFESDGSNAEWRSREAILSQNGESCDWWTQGDSNSRPPACKAGALAS